VISHWRDSLRETSFIVCSEIAGRQYQRIVVSLEVLLHNAISQRLRRFIGGQPFSESTADAVG